MARHMADYKTAAQVKEEHAADIDDDEELAKIRRMRGRGKRIGVSSDTSSAADDENYEAKYFPKTDEQMARIVAAVSHSFLFDNLSNHQKKEIFDASPYGPYHTTRFVCAAQVSRFPFASLAHPPAFCFLSVVPQCSRRRSSPGRP